MADQTDHHDLSFDDFDELRNPGPEVTGFEHVVEKALSRRQLLGGAAAAANPEPEGPCPRQQPHHPEPEERLLRGGGTGTRGEAGVRGALAVCPWTPAVRRPLLPPSRRFGVTSRMKLRRG